jgi:hypothetical protein
MDNAGLLDLFAEDTGTLNLSAELLGESALLGSTWGSFSSLTSASCPAGSFSSSSSASSA